MSKMLSVIMGVYNCEKTLRKTLDSILNQTFTDFICFTCDDGSKDNSVNIIKEYAEKDNRIVFLQNEKNLGLAPTLNKCIKLCDSKYIARMDADDICQPDRFKKQIEFMESHKEIGLCGTSIEYFDDNGIWGKLIYPENPIAKDFLSTNPFAHPTVIYRFSELKKVINKDGLYYREDKKIGRSEDYELFMRIFAAGIKTYNMQECLLLYREDRNAFAKRKFKYAFTDAAVRFSGYKKLGLLPKGFFYVLKPIIVCMISKKIRLKLHRRKFSENK